MRLAFVVPPWAFLDKVKGIVQREFPNIHTQYMIYRSFQDAPALIDGRQKEFDAILFGGKVPYEYAHAHLKPETFWSFIPRSGNTLFCALLNAVRLGWDITRLSFDTYGQDMLREVFADIGFGPDEITFLSHKGKLLDKSYIADAVEFHSKNFHTGRAHGCITSLFQVHQQLDTLHIPNIMVSPTRNVIRDQVDHMHQLFQSKEASKGQITVVLINIGFPPHYSVIQESDDRFMMEKIKITQHIYRYAGLLQAAVVDASIRDYLIFTSRDIIDAETTHYQHLQLLDWLELDTLYQVAVGIGHGESVTRAKQNALAAMLQARRHSRSAAYALFDNGDLAGPIFSGDRRPETLQIDGKLYRVAEQTGLSVNTIYNLHCFMTANPKDGYTSQELSEGLSISKRSTDRLVQRLEQCGYLSIIGKRMIGASGRPSRVIAIQWDDA